MLEASGQTHWLGKIKMSWEAAQSIGRNGRICLCSLTLHLDQGQQTSSVKGQIVNILGFVGHIVCSNYSTLSL